MIVWLKKLKHYSLISQISSVSTIDMPIINGKSFLERVFESLNKIQKQIKVDIKGIMIEFVIERKKLREIYEKYN